MALTLSNRASLATHRPRLTMRLMRILAEVRDKRRTRVSVATLRGLAEFALREPHRMDDIVTVLRPGDRTVFYTHLLRRIDSASVDDARVERICQRASNVALYHASLFATHPVVIQRALARNPKRAEHILRLRATPSGPS